MFFNHVINNVKFSYLTTLRTNFFFNNFISVSNRESFEFIGKYVEVINGN